jgi:hypothetical protein
MPIVEMAESESIPEREPGAPVAADAIDPDLVKLTRSRPKIGIITALGIVILCGYFLLRLGPDRHFGGAGSKPNAVALGDIASGKVADDEYIVVEAEPLMSHAIRTVKAIGDLGLRVVPTRGTNDRVWLALTGDGWNQPTTNSRYSGRLRRISDLPFADTLRTYATEHPRPVFAVAGAVRTAMASGKVKTVDGNEVTIGDDDRVAFDLVDPKLSTIVGSLNPRFPTVSAWTKALADAGITAKLTGANTSDEVLGQARFDVAMSAPEATKKLEEGKLFATRVESVTHHFSTTWGALKKSGAGGFMVDTTTIPDAQIDLVGLYTARVIPTDAYALMVGETPDDYWYVLWITVSLAIIGLLFGWALIRAIRRDLLPTRA